jgi:hypothetical protein
MLTLLLIAAAAALVLNNAATLERLRLLVAAVPRPAVSWQHVVAGVLLALALASLFDQGDARPIPPPPVPHALRLEFAGPTAAEDACTVAALTQELADEIEWDGSQKEPRFRTGVALDDLRRRAREMRCRGVSIGDRQPFARDAIAAYLDEAVGNEGGPIDAAQRAAWVTALRDISEAASSVTR